MTEFNLGALLQDYKENNEITVLEPGTYTLEVTACKSGTAKAGPTITPVFKVYAGPQAGARVMTGKISFSSNAMWKTVPLLEGMGVTQEFMYQANSTSDPFKTIADSIVGRVIEATVTVENWQGEDRNKLDRTSLSQPGGPQAPPPPSYQQAQQFTQGQTTGIPESSPLPPQTAAPTPSF